MMSEARRQTQGRGCTGVKSLADFAEFLEKTAGTKDSILGQDDLSGESPNLTYMVVVENGFTHIILKNDDLLKKLKEGNVSHLDGTFGSRPNLIGCAQLVTLMVRKYDRVSFGKINSR